MKLRTLSALLIREWVMMKSWLLSLVLLMTAGPVIHLINALGAPRATKHAVEVTSLFTSLYTTTPMGEMSSVHHHLAAANYNQSTVPIIIHGAPPAGLWVIACATVLGALLATLDRQPSVLVDTLSAPVRKQDLVQAKLILGTAYLALAALLRTFVLYLLNVLSPFHFAIHTLLLSGTVNFLVSLASFCVVFFVGLLIGNTILAWSLGFLTLSFPLAFGAVIRFIGHVTRTFSAAYELEHRFVLRLSPFWYTNYNTNTHQNVASSALGSTAVQPKIQNIVMETGISHPVVIVTGALVVFGLVYAAGLIVAARSKTENMENLFLTRQVLYTALVIVSVVFGSVAAQIIAHAELWTFVGAALACYTVLWILESRIRIWVARKRVSTGETSMP